MAKALVIVESPTKAKTIEKYLGSGYKVTSSYGHVRDLPNNAKEIPEKVKKEKWTRLGVNVDSKFEPLYIIPDKKKKRVKDLKDLLKKSDELYLATDEDREGESISWHLLEVLKPKVPVKRLVFNEITKKAIQNSLNSAREVNMDMVKAQEARRVLDRLYGYTLSPLLWKKMLPRLSAGRVQSVATRLLVERERSRVVFKTANYWDLKATFKKGEKFEAELTHVGEKRVAQGRDFDPLTGKLKTKDVIHLDEKKAKKLEEDLQSKSAIVNEVETKPFTTKPSPPFTTSTLQQEASRKLGFAAKRTMGVAQVLYENGLITYMRTDSTTLSSEALDAARTYIKKDYGKDYLPDSPREYKTKVKNAQEAHEAVRPAGGEFKSPEEVKKQLGVEAFKLYDLIWKRTVASQMKDAKGFRVTARIKCEDALFRASGKTIEFPGFLRAYVEGSDDPEADLADQEKLLPKLTKNDKVDTVSLQALGHDTKPPARYTEGSLIKELERLGIGRPSTWASIVDVILNRGYAFKRGPALVPTFLAMALTGLMEQYFTTYVDYEFTASMEDDLDAIAVGKKDNLKYLTEFYHGNGIPGLKKAVTDGEEKIDPRVVCGMPIGKSKSGKDLEVRVGRYGPFITDNLEDNPTRASVPDRMAPDELTLEIAENLIEIAERGPQPLGVDPESGKNVYAKTGRYGPYVQLGEPEKETGEKPKMASLLQGMNQETMDLETALKLLSLPINLGKHPDLGEDIESFNGRYGPYIKCGKETRTLPGISPLEVTFDEAVKLLNEPKKRGRGVAKPPLKELGVDPGTEKNLVIKDGRFGPYVTDGEVNASLTKGMTIEEVTLEDGANLLAVRRAKLAAKAEEEG